MTPADLFRLARTVVAGLAARAWRLVVGGPCPCEMCGEHREFYDDPRRHITHINAETAAHLSTLDEVRRRRGA